MKHAGSTVGVFEIAVIPDRPPEIELTDAPRFNARGSLTLAYKINDDYGAASAEAVFSDPSVEGVSGTVRSLVAPPHLSLVLPQGGIGEAETTGDLSSHPWAGARVKIPSSRMTRAAMSAAAIPSRSPCRNSPSSSRSPGRLSSKGAILCFIPSRATGCRRRSMP